MDITWVSTVLLALIISSILYSSWNAMYRRRNLPPGPTPLPIVGNVLQIRRGKLVQSLMEFAEEYGSVYTVYFGHNPIVVLSGYETVKEALLDRAEEFGGRGRSTFDDFFEGHGIVFSNGERWKDLRRFSLTMLRNFGMGKKSIEEKIQEEAGFLVAEFKSLKDKVLEEINQVIGQNRIPQIEDRNKMPYTDAVIHEIQRFTDLFPADLPHLVTKDINFKGYTIPKGTDVYPLLCTVHRDPKMFTTPNKFNPNHFLDSNGCFKKNEAYMPFSAGKRICAGEALARMELFLFITTILQNFKLTSKTKITDEDIKPTLTGSANIPIFYEMSFVSRAL